MDKLKLEQKINAQLREEINNELSIEEMDNLIHKHAATNPLNPAHNNPKYIKNIAKHMAETFKRIDGFDYRWNTLITSTPLLFECIDYMRCLSNIDAHITTEEIELYRNKKLRKVYATTENLLMDNLLYYNRIMSIITMSTYKYIRIDDDFISHSGMEGAYIDMDLTPSKIYAAAMTSVHSTKEELEYAWNMRNLQVIEGKSPLEANWDRLSRNANFRIFHQYVIYRTNAENCREGYITDKTSNAHLSRLCRKFTNTSTALSEYQLEGIHRYADEQEIINTQLYESIYKCLLKMFENDDAQFAIYVYTNEFFIHSSKFSIKVMKTPDGKIAKEYMANSYECFLAEEGLVGSIKAQIAWAKYTLPAYFKFDKDILFSLLHNMIESDYKNIMCMKRMNEYGVVSRITFKGVFNNVYICEDFLTNNHVIRSNKFCLSKKNAARYVVDRGYYLFGYVDDVSKFQEINKKNIILHYSKYCIPVMHHMADVVKAYRYHNNDVIDIMLGNKTPVLHNADIKYFDAREIKPQILMASIARNVSKSAVKAKQAKYWTVIGSEY